MTINPETNVAPEHVFHFSDGKKAHNLKDLKKAMASMSSETFAHHVDNVNNDFANWVEFVYKNPELANSLRSSTSQQDMAKVLDLAIGKFIDTLVEDAFGDSSSSSIPSAQSMSMSTPQTTPVSPPVDKKESAEEKSDAAAKQPFAEQVKLSSPPQTMLDTDGKLVHSISTEAPHLFIIKEFFLGVAFGFLLGFILIASLLLAGVFPGVC
jgi:hypothetical protein